MEVEDKEPVSPTQQEEDVRFKLETEISNLQKMLNQQVVMYNHDMELITQVCGRSAPGVSFTGVFVYSCAEPLHLCLHLSLYPSSLFPFVCIVRSVQLSVSVSLVCPFLQQSLSTSDPVTVAMQEAAKQGNQSIVQRLVKQFVNVEGKVGMESVRRSCGLCEMRMGVRMRSGSGQWWDGVAPHHTIIAFLTFYKL